MMLMLFICFHWCVIVWKLHITKIKVLIYYLFTNVEHENKRNVRITATLHITHSDTIHTQGYISNLRRNVPSGQSKC